MEHDINLILKNSWENLTHKYAVSKKVLVPIFDEIIQKYSEKNRHYHNLTHISEMLNLAQQFENQLLQFDAVCFSIWFHDIIYQATQKDNETKSAIFAQQKMRQMQIPENVVSKVYFYILTTKTHQIHSEETDLTYFLDFDLAILGASPEKYAKYCHAIRQEYEYVPLFIYRKARKKILQNFLNRPKIYHQLTDLEEIARQNIQRELQS